MTEEKVITPVVKKVLQSMKCNEIASTSVRPDYVKKIDPQFKERHPEYDETRPLIVDIQLMSLCRITDLYKDLKVFYKTI